MSKMFEGFHISRYVKCQEVEHIFPAAPAPFGWVLTKVVPVPTAGRGRTFAVDIAPGDLHSIAWGTALLDTSCTAGQI